MEVWNASVEQLLASEAAEATSAFARFRGLMLRGSLPDGGGLVIRPCGSIHMMFMRFPIDAVFFDRELQVTKVAHRVRPWIGMAFGGRRAAGVVELPVGAAGGTQVGHRLRFDRGRDGSDGEGA